VQIFEKRGFIWGGKWYHYDTMHFELLASIKSRLGELNRFWEKEQTKADVEVFILDSVYASLPTPPFTPEEKKTVAHNVYAHVWQQAMNGELAKASL
jgi:type I restriction enzyme R subunit